MELSIEVAIPLVRNVLPLVLMQIINAIYVNMHIESSKEPTIAKLLVNPYQDTILLKILEDISPAILPVYIAQILEQTKFKIALNVIRITIHLKINPDNAILPIKTSLIIISIKK
jgi:hypothetical protein